MAQILEFPYARIKLEIVPGQAEILVLPKRNQSNLFWFPMFFWMGVFNAKT